MSILGSILGKLRIEEGVSDLPAMLTEEWTSFDSAIVRGWVFMAIYVAREVRSWATGGMHLLMFSGCLFLQVSVSAGW